MKKIILIIVLMAIGYATYEVADRKGIIGGFVSDETKSDVWKNGTDEPVQVPELNSANSKEYADSTRGFSFRYPDYLEATSFQDVGGDIVLVQSTDKAQGFQILISPWTESETLLTVDMIQRDIPDLEIANPQDLLLGESGKGIAFLSDNESFGGSSREVWFAFRGNLYQISTYARLDPLLQAVLATWKFE